MGGNSRQMHLGYPWGLAVQDPYSLTDIKDDTPMTFQGKYWEWEITPFCSLHPLRMKLL